MPNEFPWRAPALVAVGAVLLTGACRKQPETAATRPVSGSQAPLPREITTPAGMTMALIPAGEFKMGSPDEIDARPVRSVSIGSFYMGKHEVTQDVYEKVMGKNPSRVKAKRNPVERVSWLDAVRFCNALSTQEGLRACYDLKTKACDFAADGYRLPTETEWEYACRAGTAGDFPFSDGEAGLGEHAWFKANAMGTPHRVGKKRCSPFGLYDMAGNVREWCHDWYQVDAYKQDAGTRPTDPRGPGQGEKKVLRGGAWSVSAESCKSWTRYCDDPGFTDACLVNDDCGFRVVRRPKRTDSGP